MKPAYLGFSEMASDIEMKRPRGWELLLLAQLLDEEIDSVNLALQQDIGIKTHHSTDFYLIKNFDDLKRIFSGISKEMPLVEGFINIFSEMSSGKNEAAFGPNGKPGNPVLIQLLAKRVASSYYEMAIFVKRMELEKIEFQTFFRRNINPKLDGQRLLCNAIEAANTWYINNTKNLINIISDYSNLVREKLNNLISGGPPIALSISIDSIGIEEFEGAIKSATEFMLSEHQNVAFTNNTSTNQEISTIKAPPLKRFISLNQVVNWLVEKKEIKQSELRDILLPLDYFPGVFIDVVNERALDLTGEAALDETNNQIHINQDILLKVVENENKVFQV